MADGATVLEITTEEAIEEATVEVELNARVVVVWLLTGTPSPARMEEEIPIVESLVDLVVVDFVVVVFVVFVVDDLVVDTMDDEVEREPPFQGL